jgi:ATP-dependent Clp protease adaptor protein ClpS
MIPPKADSIPLLSSDAPAFPVGASVFVSAQALELVRSAGDDGEGGGDGGGDRRNGDDNQVGIATKTRAKPKKPSQFKVLMLNDDYTPMEFVVLVLKRFFGMDLEQATRVMLHVHQKGVGVCGIFPYEIAETKVNQVMDFARENMHPLQCTLEKA